MQLLHSLFYGSSSIRDGTLVQSSTLAIMNHDRVHIVSDEGTPFIEWTDTSDHKLYLAVVQATELCSRLRFTDHLRQIFLELTEPPTDNSCCPSRYDWWRATLKSIDIHLVSFLATLTLAPLVTLVRQFIGKRVPYILNPFAQCSLLSLGASFLFDMPFAAEFTRESDEDVICERCKVIFPAGTVLLYLENFERGKSGRNVCQDCYEYYLQKPTTREIPGPGPSTAQQNRIHKQVAAGQRGETSNPVRPIGNIGRRDLNRRHRPQSSMLPPPVPHQGPSNGPMVQTPGMLSHYSALPFPKNFHSPILDYGYQPAHKRFTEMRDYFVTHAYRSDKAEHIIVNARMMTLIPGRQRPVIVADITETIGHIPVRIGVRDLKVVVFTTLLPLFIRWSRGYPLTIENTELRLKSWLELTPRVPDENAVGDQFFKVKGKNTAKKFTPGNGTAIYLALPHEIYEAASTHATNVDDAETKNQSSPAISTLSECDSLSISSTSRSHVDGLMSSKIMGKQKAIEPPFSEDDEPPTKRSRITMSPDVHKVKRALQIQKFGGFARKAVQSLFKDVTVACRIYSLPRSSFKDLVESPTPCHDIFADRKPTLIHLIFDPDAPCKKGSFKRAQFGHITSRQGDDPKSVCIKQCFQENAVPSNSSSDPGPSSLILYDNHKQAELLTIELNCLRWASALMGLVYEFMESVEQTRGKPPFDVPQMSFVQVALAIADTESQETYLIEDWISRDEDGLFVKYINNASAKPCLFPPEHDDRRVRAQFLAFAQHVQYIKTQKMAYVSDFQGGLTQLSDPQIITSPVLGRVFGDGNVNFDMLLEEHDCDSNDFCCFYEPAPLPSSAPAIDTPFVHTLSSGNNIAPASVPILHNTATPSHHPLVSPNPCGASLSRAGSSMNMAKGNTYVDAHPLENR